MKNLKHSKLIVVKIQNYLSIKLKSRLLATAFFPFLPVFFSGLVIQWIYNYNIYKRSVMLSLLWLAFAPFLIQSALTVLHNFFDEHDFLLDNKEKWNELKNKFISLFETRRFILFEILWGLATSLTICFTLFYTAPFPVKIWAFISYFILFFLAATGIRGILLLSRIISSLCDIKIKVDPLHFDNFGGLKSFGKFIIQGTLYFSTGALLFPLVFDILRMMNKFTPDLRLAVYFLTLIFIITLLHSFFSPTIKVKKYVEKEKERLLEESMNKINKIYLQCMSEKDNAFPVELYYYNEIYHKKVLAIKEYPYDATVLFELLEAVFIPIIVGVLEVINLVHHG